MTIIKSKISRILFNRLGISMCNSKKIVDVFFESISRSLENGEDIQISGFGKFVLHNKKKRLIWDFKKKRKILINERRVVTFKSGKKLKLKVKETKLLN